MEKRLVRLLVNGEQHDVAVWPNETLVEVLRDRLELTGTKMGCGEGACGTCTVLLDGKPVRSCLTLAVEVQDREIMTIEGLSAGRELHPVQQAFIEHGAIQCGFCSPAMILTSKALLDENPQPSEAEVRRALSGVVCRCTGYAKIVQAVLAAADSV